MSTRYAIYFSPAEHSALSRFGSTILGREPSEPRSVDSTSSFQDQGRWRTITKRPAHYGFHATLKAPFELNPRYDEQQLLAAVASFSAREPALLLPHLAPRRLSHFLALTVAEQSPQLTDFAQRIVEHFESFRKPLSSADRQRRETQNLTARQSDLLQQFGYPYVAEEFRFHMTLSGILQDTDADYERWVDEQYQLTVSGHTILDQLAVFSQPDRQSAFVQRAVFPLGAVDAAENGQNADR